MIAGTYDRFNEIGRAWSSGNMGDLWRHITFGASPQARDVATRRLFPPKHPDLVSIERMASSPIGTIASAIGRTFGASQQTQDALLATGSLAERFAGAGTSVYKQTLTAPARLPGTYASTRRIGQAGPTEAPNASNYRALFLKARPDLPNEWAVHHGIPQRYEELMHASGVNIHQTQFLRGVSQTLHSKVTTEWERFHHAAGGNPSAAEVAEFAKDRQTVWRQFCVARILRS